jgi:hypothetical protein
MTGAEAHALGFVLNWAQGRATPSDGQATLATRVLVDGARKSGLGEWPASVSLSSTAAMRERLIQLRNGPEDLTGDECAAIGIVFDLLDRIERRGMENQR